MLLIILAIISSYLLGSLPTAYLYGRIFKGLDIRKHGSGNVGATNALRVFGKKAGAFVLLIDVIKGIIPVIFIADFILLRNTCFNADLLRIILGLACVLGHNWTVFLNFKGGKGVATGLGVLIGLSSKLPNLALISAGVILIWFLIFLFTKIVSFASISVAIVFPILIILFKSSMVLVFFSIFFIYLFKNNYSFGMFWIWLLKLQNLKNIEVLALPLGFSLASIIETISLIVLLYRKIGDFGIKEIFASYGKIIFSCVFLIISTYLALYFASLFVNMQTFWGIFWQTFVAGSVGFVSYFFVAFILKMQELDLVVLVILKKMKLNFR